MSIKTNYDRVHNDRLANYQKHELKCIGANEFLSFCSVMQFLANTTTPLLPIH